MGACQTCNQPVTSEVQRRSHDLSQHGPLRATNLKYAGKGGVQSTGASAVSQGVSADAGRPELLEMHLAVLQLRQARDLGVTPASNQLKPTNRALELRIYGFGAIPGTHPNL
jgi:hypothetical protein